MRSITDIFRSYGVLDAQGRHVNGTDKETNHHYGDAYEKLVDDHFRHYDTIKYDDPREAVELMMEVGIADGSSLLAWSEVFPNAICVGLDIHQSNRAHGDRIEFVLGDQRSKQDCDFAASNRQFDFICEDGTHLLEDSLRTLLYLWPYVRPGGLYVIEEFAGVGSLRENITFLWPCAQIVDTVGPSGGVEPLVVLRKPL
jgi:cephalosporin hydroxylase